MKKLKGVLVGDFNAGKTSLVTRLFDNVFKPTQSTIGVEFRSSVLLSELKISLWDTAGSEHYRSIVPMYFRNVDFICIVLDHTDIHLTETFEYWLGMVDRHANPVTPVAVLVNKYDLPAGVEGVGTQLATIDPLVDPIMVSAKCDTNVVLLQKLLPFWQTITPRPRPKQIVAISKSREYYSCC